MKFSSRVGYFFAGAMLTNSWPHFVVALTGRRNPTGFGRDSSPAANALWGAINFVCGCLLVLRTDQRAGAKKDPEAWILPSIVGSLCMTLFGVVYELRKRWPYGRD